MSNPTDTNQASELYELCREVYRLFPFWAGTDMIYGKEQDGDWKIMPLTLSIPKRNRIPLYSSDYLLEKLPPTSVARGVAFSVATRIAATSEQLIGAEGDTPLKALLKLTIALSEAGELNE